MSYEEYDCCAVCDQPIRYSTPPDRKQEICPECVEALEPHGVIAASADELIQWMLLDPLQAKKILIELGYTRCTEENDIDSIFDTL